jgi:hypothetical protein
VSPPSSHFHFVGHAEISAFSGTGGRKDPIGRLHQAFLAVAESFKIWKLNLVACADDS